MLRTFPDYYETERVDLRGAACVDFHPEGASEAALKQLFGLADSDIYIVGIGLAFEPEENFRVGPGQVELYLHYVRAENGQPTTALNDPDQPVTVLKAERLFALTDLHKYVRSLNLFALRGLGDVQPDLKASGIDHLSFDE